MRRRIKERWKEGYEWKGKREEGIGNGRRGMKKEEMNKQGTKRNGKGGNRK